MLPSLLGGGGGGEVEPPTKFSKREFAGKERVDVFQGELQFIHRIQTKI